MSNTQTNSHNHIIYLLRHADCRQDSVKRYIGQIDLPLNLTGIEQAFALSQELKDIPLQQIFCSDLRRSYETARIISRGRHELIRQIEEMREIDLGKWDGLPMAEVSQQFPQEYAKRGRDIVCYRAPGGENFHDLAARVIPQFINIAQAACGNVLIVGHAGVNRVILCHILGMPLSNLFRLQQDYGGVNLLTGDKSGMSLLKMNIMPFRAENHSLKG
jgi:alpha-ribazole phosphatase